MDYLKNHWPMITFVVAVVFAAGKLFADVQNLKDEVATLKKDIPDIDMSRFLASGDIIKLGLPGEDSGLELNLDASGRERQAYIGTASSLVIRKGN